MLKREPVCQSAFTISNMEDEEKIWLPYELNELYHDCPNKPAGKENVKLRGPTNEKLVRDQQQEQEEKEKPITVQQLKIWLDRLAKVGVDIDIKSIMKPNDGKEREEVK